MYIMYAQMLRTSHCRDWRRRRGEKYEWPVDAQCQGRLCVCVCADEQKKYAALGEPVNNNKYNFSSLPHSLRLSPLCLLSLSPKEKSITFIVC